MPLRVIFSLRTFSLLLALLPTTGLASPAPRLPSGSLRLENTATIASYNPAHKQADWVFYPLGESELRDCVKRSNSFRPDPRLPREASAQLSDYSGSGYDRGHLSPAGDNRWSREAMRESFLLSNISPQPARFNQGIWSRLEGLVRAWARQLGGLWVTTGPLLHEGLPAIGGSQVSVPEFFYKVLATREKGRSRAIAFLLPATASGANLPGYALSVRALEELSGLDFLAGLPGEREAENELDPKAWDFEARFGGYLPCPALSPSALEWSWGITP